MQQVASRKSVHDQIVVALVGYLKRQGVAVEAAACPGYPDPEAVGHHEPDALGRDARRVIVIGEAKTGDGDLTTPHSREQFRDFANRIMTNTRVPCPFYVCVPKHAETDLRAVLREEGVLDKANVHIVTVG